MDELIQRSFSGGLSDLEAGRLRSWRRASPENETHYLEMRRLWELTSPEAVPGRSMPPGALERVLTTARRRKSRRIGWRTGLAAAAVVLAMAGGVWYGLDRWEGPLPIGAAEFSTGDNERVTITLNDGSFVRLGPRSRLSFIARPGARDIWLDGRAFFAVAPDPRRPFQVRTRSGSATALGTQFEVLVEADNLRLAVVEGRVALEAEGGEVEVGAGEVSHTRAGLPPSVVKVDDFSALVDLPTKLLVFQATPLPQAARELERHFGVTTRLTSPLLADRLVSAWFEGESLELVVTTICRVTQSSCTIRGDTVVVQP